MPKTTTSLWKILSEAQLSSSSPREKVEFEQHGARAVREEEVFLRGSCSTSCEIQSPWTLTGKRLISPNEPNEEETSDPCDEGSGQRHSRHEPFDEHSAP